MEFIDGELCILNDQGEIIHVFERGDLKRAPYKHMTAWVLTNFDPKLDPTALWTLAKKSWDDMSPQNQVAIWTMCNQEETSARDIRDGLLATLHGYQGVKSVKDAYKEAIKNVCEKY
jgi:hypothetical protein